MRRASIGYELGFISADGAPFLETIKHKVGYYDLPEPERDAVFSIVESTGRRR
jgi:hypothetical protein